MAEVETAITDQDDRMLCHQLLRRAQTAKELYHLKHIWAWVTTDAMGPYVVALGADSQL